MDICPVYHYREWLRLTPIEIPDLVFRYRTFQSNVSYYIHDVTEAMFKEGKKKEITEKINKPNRDFKVKWKIRKMIHDYMQKPLCKKCGEIAYDRKGEWEGLELCWPHQLLIIKTYETKINPLKTEGQYGIPEQIERSLRQKLIEGDPLFDDVTIEVRQETS